MCDDPNCTHGAVRRGWDAVGRFFGNAWGHSENATATQNNVTAGPIEQIPEQKEEPSFFKQLLLATPVLGATINSSDKMGEGNYAGAAADFGVGVLDLFTLGTANKYKAGSEVVIGSAEKAMANEGTTVVGEGMDRVIDAAAKIPGAKILNTMPKFTGTADQITSQMMQYNRQWILSEMRSGRTILDIGLDVNRANPSIFYQMEQNMMKNYKLLHP